MAPSSEITNPRFYCHLRVLGPGSWVLGPSVWLRTALAFRSDLGDGAGPCRGAGFTNPSSVPVEGGGQT